MPRIMTWCKTSGAFRRADLGMSQKLLRDGDEITSGLVLISAISGYEILELSIENKDTIWLSSSLTTQHATPSGRR